MAAGEVYFSVDIETDGPIPGPHSLLSLGAAAFADGEQLSTFEAVLAPLDGAAPHPDTQSWWERQDPQVYAAARRDPRDPAVVMAEFDRWVRAQPGRPVFVAYPAGFDFTWVFWYLHRFVGTSVFSHSALDVKTLGMYLLGCGYREVSKKKLTGRWPVDAPHTHVAVDDAIEQGELFVMMHAAARDASGRGR